MNRVFTFIIVLFLFSCAQEVEDNDIDIRGKIVAFNGLAESFSVIDPDSLSISNDVALTGKAPNQMVHNGESLYLINSLDNNIIKYDIGTFEILSEIYLGSGKNPYMMDIDDKYIYVSCWMSDSVIIIDKSSEEIVTEISVGARPQGVLAVENRLYVTNVNYAYDEDKDKFVFKTGSYSLIDTDNLELIKNIDLEYKNPQTLLYNEVWDEIHIICSGSNSNESDGQVVVVKNDSVLKSFNIGGSPVYGEGSITGNRVFLSGIGSIRSYNLDTYEVYEATDLGVDEFIPSVIIADDRIYVSIFSLSLVKIYDLVNLDHIKDLQGSDGVQQLLYIQE